MTWFLRKYKPLWNYADNLKNVNSDGTNSTWGYFTSHFAVSQRDWDFCRSNNYLHGKFSQG